MPKATKKEGGKGGGGRKTKDKNAPKRPLAAYMFYCKDQREDVKRENPEATFTDIGKLLGERWKTLTEKDKKLYVKQAEDDKKRYEKEMQRYGGDNEDD